MGRGRELLRFCSSLRCGTRKSPSSTFAFRRLIIPFSSSFSSKSYCEDDKRSPKCQRDSLLLEKFRLRKLKGSSTTSQSSPQASCSTSEKVIEQDLKNEDESSKVVTNFEGFGLREGLIEVLEKLGLLVATEIQCVGIPAVLEGMSVLMSSVSGPESILAYLLPLIQLLRQGTKFSHSNSWHPRAIVLCATEEKAEQRGRHSWLEVIRRIKLMTSHLLGSLHATRHKAIDCMFDSGLSLEVCKILGHLPDHTSEFTNKGLQTVLVTSTITEVLGEESTVIKLLENSHAGIVSALLLEMDRAEVFQVTESLDDLRQKMTEAVNSFLK